MIEGVIHHCTEMEVDRQYVDSHGQSTVAFAFCRLLGFQLMPRLKAIHAQKLYRPEAGQAGRLPEFTGHPDEADRLGTDPPAIRPDGQIRDGPPARHGGDRSDPAPVHTNNVQHPTYKAFAELGKAVKTIFLCRYLHSEALRREINEGLNVIEQWNSANDFIFFARRGELVSNRREDHEVSMLALHLLQNCMVYINTLMLQQVLGAAAVVGKTHRP